MAAPRPDELEYHRRFAEAIIEQIRSHTAPWQKPWQPGESYRPENFATGNPYRGGNSIYLSVRGAERGFADNRWATYKQIQSLGGQVRKAERGERILFFDNTRKIPVNNAEGRPTKDSQGRSVYRLVNREVPFFKQYTVFNVDQADGLQLERPAANRVPLWQAHEGADAVVEESKVSIRHVPGDRAFYSLHGDEIVLPERAQFPSANHYYQTVLHELGHATGHPERMDRATFKAIMVQGFGSPAHAKEELRAEISAMMTGDRLGVGHDPARGAAYVEDWVAALQEDPVEIHRAAAEAERMSAYLVAPAVDRIKRAEKRRQNQVQQLAGLTPSPVNATPDRTHPAAPAHAPPPPTPQALPQINRTTRMSR